MNREDIIKLAQKAGFDPHDMSDDFSCNLIDIERFAALVAAAECEACAELVVRGTDEPVQTKTLEILRKERERIAAAIRARGQT